MSGHTPWALYAIAIAVASGCYSGPLDLDPASDLQLGVIGLYLQEHPNIEVPESVEAGAPFTVRVTTWGYPCNRLGPTDVATHAEGILITPFDYGFTGPCFDIYATFEHEVEVTFARRGRNRIVVRGREPSKGAVVEFTSDVMVW